ncbi:flavin reductase family protein [Streptomyces sp. NPDC005562]|uniref:flavin reductase family protein n=1 Tax=unclassified Streptomyces TaxID=2593676 RepID=UPI0033AA421E
MAGDAHQDDDVDRGDEGTRGDDVDRDSAEVDEDIAVFTGLPDPGVYVVTAAAEGERAGCLVGFASQCSVQPSRFAVWLSTANHTYRLALRTRTLVVHLLPHDRHDLADRFGSLCSAETDKFAGLDWHEGPDGTPVLDDALAWFAGRVHSRFDGGDHVAFVLDPVAAYVAETEDRTPLSLHDASDINAGHPV